MATLPKEDYRIFDELKEAKVLVSIDRGQIDPRGVQIVPCSDGEQFPDIFMHHRRHCERVQPIALFGGALLIPEASPLRQPDLREDLVLLSHIRFGASLPGIKETLIYSHICRAALLKRLTVLQMLYYLVQAKYRVRKEIPGIDLGLAYQVDYGDRKRSYFVKRARWEDWCLVNASRLAL